MTAQHPLFVRASTAARMLDMSVPEFRRLVAEGALPPPCRLDRWDVEQLRAIMRGEAHRPREELDL